MHKPHPSPAGKLRRVLALILTACCLFTLPGLTASADNSEILTCEATPPTLAGKAGYLLEANTNTPLFSQNGDERLYPASITKIMTALVAIENTENFNDIITFSNAAVNGIAWDSSRIGAMVGEQLTVEQTLYGLMLKSGNDCAVALAEYVAGSEAAFCELMNARAAEIGCTNTNFVNSHGLHDSNHYTTAHDMALIMKTAIQNDMFHTIDSTVSYRVPSTNMHESGFSWTMSNKMMSQNSQYYYEGVICGKTGYTSKAGNTLVTCAQRGDTLLIAVVMRCLSTHYADTKLLFDYGFNNFAVYDTADIDTDLSFTEDHGGFFGDLESVVGSSNFSITCGSELLILPKSIDLAEVTTELTYQSESSGPEDRSFATLTYRYRDRILAEVELELIPDAEAGFDFEEHQNPLPETETSIIQEEVPGGFVIKPVYLFLGIVGVLVVSLIVLALIRYFSPYSRRRRKIRAERLKRSRRAERKR